MAGALAVRRQVFGGVNICASQRIEDMSYHGSYEYTLFSVRYNESEDINSHFVLRHGVRDINPRRKLSMVAIR